MNAGLIRNRMVGWTILVVEDDEDAIQVTSRWFKLAGAALLIAKNGADGVELARSHQPTLIMSDLHMPVMDGWTLCHTLKQESSTQQIPIIALSADYSSQSKQRSKDAGFAGYIRKPLDPVKFLDTLVEVILSVPELEAKWQEVSTSND